MAVALRFCRVLRSFLESCLPSLLCDGHMAIEGTISLRTQFHQLSNGTAKRATNGLSGRPSEKL